MKQNKEFLKPGVTVDVVLFTIENNALKVLLIQRESDPYKNSFALPGGFPLKGEDGLKATERLLLEKAGIKNIFLEQLYTFDTPGRDPRGPVFSVTYFGLAPSPLPHAKIQNHTQNPHLHAVGSLPKLAFDHRNIIEYALKRLRGKLSYTNIAFSILPKYFTLSQLHNAYELILDKKLDKRNFIKKIGELNILKSTKKMTSGGRQRPAMLYTFSSKKEIALKRFF